MKEKMGSTVFCLERDIEENEDNKTPKPTAHLYGAPSPGPNPLASFIIRIGQLLLNLTVLGVVCATVKYKNKLTGRHDTRFGEISFVDFVSFRFLVAACLIAALYELFFAVISMLKMCNLLGGRQWSDKFLWLQVAGDTVTGQLVFAAASAAAMQTIYNEEGMLYNGHGKLCHLGYHKFCVLMEVGWPLAFLVALAHFGAFWVFTRAAYKTYFES